MRYNYSRNKNINSTKGHIRTVGINLLEFRDNSQTLHSGMNSELLLRPIDNFFYFFLLVEMIFQN
jgi:hypothetical protein